MQSQKYIKLNNGTMIPQMGLGVYQIEPGQRTKDACLAAINAGYRHIDTAHGYGNEESVGEAIKEADVKREDMWITSKLYPAEFGKDITYNAIKDMLARLDLEYLDLLLTHQPIGNYVEAWVEMERAVKDGLVRTIGVSNIDLKEGSLEEILEICTIKPAVVQVECHPYYNQNKLKSMLAKDDIVLESWFPIGHGNQDLLNEEIIVKMADKYNKSTTQVILRWHVQVGNIVFPKSENPIHIKENIDIFDFELSADEVEGINNLNKDERLFTMTIDELEEMMKGAGKA